MSSTIECISDENVENLPPSTLQYTTNASSKETNSSKLKRTDYLKQQGRRKKWWYFNRGLQPISEVSEIKEDPLAECYPTITNEDDTIINRNDCLNIKNDSLNIINSLSSDNIIISSENTNIPQGKESYSPCLKVIEKFQEIVLDSAVRVIQAAFKRFRERRRFLKIKKAVLVIQRNLRKWLEAKHPCLRPAEFERQSSDGSKSDEYRESEERNVDVNFLTDQDDNINESTDFIQGSQVEEHELDFDKIKLEEISQKSSLEHETHKENLQTLSSESDTHAWASQSGDEVIKSADRNVNTSDPTNRENCLDNIGKDSEAANCDKRCPNGSEIQGNNNSAEENTSGKAIDTLELEENPTYELLQNNNKYTQNDIPIVEMDSFTISESAKDFPDSTQSKCNDSINETQIVMDFNQETTSDTSLDGSDDEEKEEHLKPMEPVSENSSEKSPKLDNELDGSEDEEKEKHLKPMEPVSENSSEKSLKLDNETEENQMNVLQNDDVSNDTPFVELSAQNNNNNNENNMNGNDNENNLNPVNMVCTTHETDNDLSLENKDASMQKSTDENEISELVSEQER